MQQAWPERFMFNRKSDSSQKLPRPTEMVAEAEGNLEWRVEEGEDGTSVALRPTAEMGPLFCLTNSLYPSVPSGSDVFQSL